MNKKGFTLIELLAVIVVLTIILLIAMPIVINVINDARKGAFEATALGLAKTVENEYMRNSMRGDEKEEVTYNFDENGNQTVDPISYNELEFTGGAPKGGYIKMYPDGSIEIAIEDGNFCATKSRDGNTVSVVTLSSVEGICEVSGGSTEYAGYPILRWQNAFEYPSGTSLTEVPDGYTGIYTVTDLENITATGNYIQMSDLDLQGMDWTPVGSSPNQFEGIYDGNYYTIDNLTTNRTTNRGLFAYCWGCTLKNINLTNVNIQTPGGSSTALTGGLVSYAENNLIENCTVSGNIYSTTSSSGTGGLVGYLSNGEIRNSHCINCDVSCQHRDCGGLVGAIYPGSVYDSSMSGSVVSSNDHVGGIAGRHYTSGEIRRSFNLASVTGFDMTGGLVGMLDGGSIYESYNKGNVNGNDYVGGIIGMGPGPIENSYSIANISGSQYVGGFHSATYGLIRNNYVSGTVTGSAYLGGFSAEDWGNIPVNSYFDSTISGLGDIGQGTPRPTAEMQYPHDSGTTYIGWDFDTIWGWGY